MAGFIALKGIYEADISTCFPALTAGDLVYADAGGSLAGLTLTNGQLPIGRSGLAPIAASLSGTIDQVTITSSSGSIILSLPQSIATTSSPSFTNLTVSGLTASMPLKTDALKGLVSGLIALGTDVSGVLDVTHGGTGSVSTLNNNRIIVSVAGAFAESAALTNGQLLIGSTGLAPSVSALTGTLNQVVITNAAGTITISTPQDIGTASTVTFGGVTDSSLTISMPIKTDASKRLVSSAIALTTDVSGILPIANGGCNSSTALTNGKLMVSSAGTIIEGTSSTSPSFTGITISGVTATTIASYNGSKALQSTTLTNANGTNVTFTGSTLAFTMTQDLRTTASPSFASASFTTNGPVVTSLTEILQYKRTPTSSVITIQDSAHIAVGARNYIFPDRASGSAASSSYILMTESDALINGMYQFNVPVYMYDVIKMNTGGVATHNTTITHTDPAADSTYTIPDAGASANFVMSEVASTINGVKTFGSAPIISSLTASMPVKTNGSKALVSSAISLTADISGVLPVANGGTNSASALTNGKIMISSGSAIVEGTSSTSPTFTGKLTVTDTSLTLDYGITLAGYSILRTDTSTTSTAIGLYYQRSGALWTFYNSDFGGSLFNVSTTGCITPGLLECGTFKLGGYMTISTSSALARNITLADPGANASLVTTEGAQTLNGALTLAATPVFGSLTASTALYLDASKNLATRTLTNGQLMIGSTGSVPVNATLTGTTNQVNIVSGPGTITLSTPQSIGTSSAVTFASVTLQTTGGTASALNYYEEYTHTSALQGTWAAGSNPTSTWDITRVGRKVTATTQASCTATATISAAITFVTALPARFRPASETVRFWNFAQNNGTPDQSRCDIQTDGVIKFWWQNGSNFTGAGTTGIYKSSFTWSI